MSPPRFYEPVPSSVPDITPGASPTWQHVVLALGLTGMSFLFIGSLVALGSIDVMAGAWVSAALMTVINSLVFGKPLLRRARRALALLIAPEDQL